jgi:hypothetical protein
MFMAYQAKVSREWKRRMIMIAGFLTLLGCWFFYDGFLGYPKKNEAYTVYHQLKAEQRLDEWPQIAQSRGWAKRPPEKLYSPGDIRGQFVLGGVSFVLAITALIWMFANRNSELRSDDEAVYAPNGRRVPFGAIIGINKRKWDSKGIAVLQYQINGKRGKLKLDDYKYAGAADILGQIEEQIARKTPA